MIVKTGLRPSSIPTYETLFSISRGNGVKWPTALSGFTSRCLLMIVDTPPQPRHLHFSAAVAEQADWLPSVDRRGR
jgi:hypothetical protein